MAISVRNDCFRETASPLKLYVQKIEPLDYERHEKIVKQWFEMAAAAMRFLDGNFDESKFLVELAEENPANKKDLIKFFSCYLICKDVLFFFRQKKALCEENYNHNEVYVYKNDDLTLGIMILKKSFSLEVMYLVSNPLNLRSDQEKCLRHLPVGKALLMAAFQKTVEENFAEVYLAPFLARLNPDLVDYYKRMGFSSPPDGKEAYSFEMTISKAEIQKRFPFLLSEHQKKGLVEEIST